MAVDDQKVEAELQDEIEKSFECEDDVQYMGGQTEKRK